MVGRSLDAAVWRPSHARFMRDQVIGLQRNTHAGYTERDHLTAAARWLARAQDVTGDGGVSGRYSLRTGWSSSYPETTGYIIPTFLSLARELDTSFRERAGRCVEFLSGIQLADGAFPAGELHENRSRPSVFNTAQILNGLVAWHAETGDSDAGDAAIRAANWLVSQQDPDGCWRRNIYNGVTTYTTHASCWLRQAAKHFGVEKWSQGAEQHLNWALSQVDSETGWINRCGFDDEDHLNQSALTHTIAYTLWGLLDLSQSLAREDGLAVVRRAADRIARRIELSGWLPGALNSRWKASAADYACLTGNAQMALIWFRLAEIDGDKRFVNAALKAIDLVKLAQPMDNSDAGIRGGIPGSAPVWGHYIYMGIPNWAAKYFIDALLAKRDALAKEQSSRGFWTIPRDIPRDIPIATPAAHSPLRVVMLSSADSHKVAQMTAAWSEWGFKPAAVVIEERGQPSLSRRVGQRMRSDGFFRPFREALVQRLKRGDNGAVRRDAPTDVAAFCEANDIPVIRVGPLSNPDSVAALRAFGADLLVHAGAGILRRDLLAIPRLGTLNAHMGILPWYRGMNVAEWAYLEQKPVGCSVYLVNEGIDTGDILAIHEVDYTGAHSISELRDIVDDAQIALLGKAVRFAAATGSLPPARRQRSDDGRQYFEMHPDLRSRVEQRLAMRTHEPVRSAPSVLAEPAPNPRFPLLQAAGNLD